CLSRPSPAPTLFPYTTLFRSLEPAVEPVGLLPGEEDLGGRAGEHREGRADGDRVAQPDGSLGGRDADALVTLAPVELGALAGVRSEEHTSELQSRFDLVCRLL